MLRPIATLHAWLLTRSTRDEGQATAEYALVLLGAAAIALLLGGWAAKTGKVGSLLNAIVDQLMAHVR
jgi:hypothetical protein